MLMTRSSPRGLPTAVPALFGSRIPHTRAAKHCSGFWCRRGSGPSPASRINDVGVALHALHLCSFCSVFVCLAQTRHLRTQPPLRQLFQKGVSLANFQAYICLTGRGERIAQIDRKTRRRHFVCPWCCEQEHPQIWWRQASSFPRTTCG